MKKLIQSLFLMLFIACQALAQDRTVTGTVTAKEDGLPLPGVSVKVSGTQIGTQTGTDGKFSLRVPDANGSLQFTYIGYGTKIVPINSNSNINIIMTLDAKQLEEVFVTTALGISKSKKSLGYAESTIKSQDINKSSAVSMFGGMQGKIAGVTISSNSGSPGGSTKVILRGFTNITGNNQPLYVIDGVPLDNSRTSSDFISNKNNYDFGNNTNDIDPNNIDNISILKGTGATALYGSRGSNGVILITTKKGTAGKFKVDFSTGTTVTNLATIYQPQETFGQGWNGAFVLVENGNWGPKFDGKPRVWGAVVNNSQLIKPYSFIKDNVQSVMDNGIELNNNIAVSGGNEASTYYLSYGNTYSNGILPGDNDSYKRNNFTLKGSTKYKNFTTDASFNYVGKTSKFVAVGQAAGGVGGSFYEELLNIPTDIPIKDLQDYKNTYFNVDNYFTPFAENPFYPLNENGSNLKSDRIYGNVNFNLKPIDWLTLQFQQGADVTNSGVKIWNNKNKPSAGSWNDGFNVESAQRQADVGSVAEQEFTNFEYDSKLNALFQKTLSSKLDFNGLLGFNYNDRGSRDLNTNIEGLAIPGFFQISNSSNKPESDEIERHRRLFGAYASATVGYNNYLYLTLSGRNDWSSTLLTGKNSYFYPSVNSAFVLSDAVNLKSTPISFAKLRVSYGKTGSDTDPYRIFNTITATDIALGFGNITFPFNGTPGYSISNQLNTADLKPSISSEYELGGEVRFFNDRIGVDGSYYEKITKDQIIPVPISPSSGYTTQIVNFGKLRNRGTEIAVSVSPVKSRDFNWDLVYTFTREKIMVLELPNGLNKVVINSAYDAQLVAIAGTPLGGFYAPGVQHDPQGKVVVDETTGFPLATKDYVYYGSMQADFTAGLSSSFSYKNFKLDFNLDYRQGGKFYSGTADLLNFVGADKRTTYNDRKPFIIPNSVNPVYNAAKDAVIGYIENTTVIPEDKIDDYYYHTSNKGMAYNNRIIDKTYLKLREVTLSYAIPKSFTNKLHAQRAVVSIYGRNLITWLPSSNQAIDPEVSNYGNDLASEFGEFRTAPPVRYFGASLKLSF